MTRRTPKAHAAMISAAMGQSPAQLVLNSLGSAVSLVVALIHAEPPCLMNCQATFGVALSRLLRTSNKQGQPLAETVPSGSLPQTIQNIVSHALERAAMPMSARMTYGASTPMVQR